MDDFPPRSALRLRVTALILTAAIIAVFGLARWLTPDARGFGTHQQLGLPECQFRMLTGHNCPQCGMTTSFGLLVRGEFERSVRTNPCGPLLASLLIGGVLPWCVMAVVTGRSVLTRQPGTTAVWLMGLYIILSLVVWLMRTDLLLVDGATTWPHIPADLKLSA